MSYGGNHPLQELLITLQQAGFTRSRRHRRDLWALTSPFASLVVSGELSRMNRAHSFHPYPVSVVIAESDIQQPQLRPDGIVSVALSLEFPPVAVSNCHPLRCPDFPPNLFAKAGRSVDDLA